ncbi:hypothetical protein K4K51_011598 [Colletotrichum sp. SAR 10_75]|nr:hypothetical protein K4K51_011598 [Colletotrichum sp. SAR 10_75]
MATGDPVLYSLYVYAPNQWAPIIFIALYGISAIFHIWQCYRYKSFKLIGLHPVCAVLFTAGYSLREYGAYHYLYSETTKTPLMVFVFSQVFIYVCPPLLELANYHVLGRIFYYVPHCAPLPPSKVLTTFGGLMAIVELLNALGVALSSNPSSTPEKQALGSHLTLAALGIQLVLIVIFICLAGLFHLRVAKAKIRSKNVTTMLSTLYASMCLIFVRCVYRLVEHTGSTKVDLDDMATLRGLSPILRYEVYFYVFEASLMLVNSLIWNVWHPGRFLPRGHHVYLARDGVEVVGEKDVDARSLWAKMANVLTFGIFFQLGAVVSLVTKPGYFVTNKVSSVSRQYHSKEFGPAPMTLVMEDSRRRKRHCWECRRRCLVCDFTEPACRRCSAAGVECPGYGDAKPMRLEWLAPGRVISRGRRRKGKRQSDGEKRHQVNNVASQSQVLARTSYVPWFEMKTDVCALPQAAEYFNSCIYRDLVPIHQFGQNPHIYPLTDRHLRVGARAPEYLQFGMVCMTLSHRLNRTRSDIQSRKVLSERFYIYWGLAVRSLTEHLNAQDEQTSDIVIAGILTILLADRRRNWEHNMPGIRPYHDGAPA